MVATRMGFIQVRWCVGSSRQRYNICKNFLQCIKLMADVDSFVYTRETLLDRITLFDAGGWYVGR